MNGVFTKSRWVWLERSCVNQYADFVQEFTWQGGDVLLRISADTNYALYINGQYVYSGQYPDYPQYKIYDTFSVGTLCRRGVNRLAVRCSYTGEDTSTYYCAPAGLLFEVVCGGKVLAASGKETLARQDLAYRSGRAEKISPQLGFGYRYDSCAEDDWTERNAPGFAPCAILAKECRLVERPVPRLRLNEDGPVSLCAQGEVLVTKEYPTAAETMYNSFLRHRTLTELGNPFELAPQFPSARGYRFSSETTGIYVLADLGEEAAGRICLDLEVEQDAEVVLCFGEHLRDLRVRSFIEGRNFAVTYRAHAGRNRWTEQLRRLGCRYVQMFILAPRAVVYDLRLVRTEYPAESLETNISDGLRRRIYETGVRTLRTCMHEHYEDCPWREQALYAMDSRNQMLFGYTVFRDAGRYAQANLRLMTHGLRGDGMLELCFPARVGITIPSFSLYFVLAVAENFEFTGDAAFLREMQPTVRAILGAFSSRIDGSGLIPVLQEEPYWNFYEWQPGLDGGAIFRDFRLPLQYDSCLNLLYIIACERWEKARAAAGEEPDRELAGRLAAMRAAVGSAFYDGERAAFAVTLREGKKEGYARLSTALAVVAGCAETEKEKLVHTLKEDGALTDVTLGNKLWLYEAVLSCGENGLAYVLNDIETTFADMACRDTTLYETAGGADDFALAGSLCHGWAAVACYVYNTVARGKV